jgi:hypothetical protein
LAEYKGLVPFEVQSIYKIAATKKGVFYINYCTSKVRGCSFISKRKLEAALTEIKGGTDGGKRKVQDVVDELVEWNNQGYVAAPLPQPSSFLQHRTKRQLIDELSILQLDVSTSEEDGEVFLRVYQGVSLVGVLVVDDLGEIYLQSCKNVAPLVQMTNAQIAVKQLVAECAEVKNQSATISESDWEELKAIAKSGKLSTSDTLAIVLDPKYLRPLAPGEKPSPRMILSTHYQQIKQRLKIRSVLPLEADRVELERIEAIYPRQARGLRELFDDSP